MILASTCSVCVLYKFCLHHKIEIVSMVVVGSESSQNFGPSCSGLCPIRLGSEKYQGSEWSGYLPTYLPTYLIT